MEVKKLLSQKELQIHLATQNSLVTDASVHKLADRTILTDDIFLTDLSDEMDAEICTTEWFDQLADQKWTEETPANQNTAGEQENYHVKHFRVLHQV